MENEYQQLAIQAFPRNLLGYRTMGVGHTTFNHELEALYHVAHLALRHAAIVKQKDIVTIVEVGTWAAEAAVILAAAVRDFHRDFAKFWHKPSVDLYVVDNFQGSPSDRTGLLAQNLHPQHLQDLCRDNLFQVQTDENPQLTPRILLGDSATIAATFRADVSNEGVDLLFVDAEHTYDAAARDITAWFPNLDDGAILAGHDYNPNEFPGVVQAVDETARSLAHTLPAVVQDTSVWWFRAPSHVYLDPNNL